MHFLAPQNVITDHKSRSFKNNTEWMLDKTVFHIIATCFGEADIDLFASCLNAQLISYVSWHPDPSAQFINAFSFTGSSHSLFTETGPEQGNWYICSASMAHSTFFHRSSKKHFFCPTELIDLLRQPSCQTRHPLSNKTKLMALR